MRSDMDIDLGLELAMQYAKCGYKMPYKVIAAFCGCSWQNIYLIEKSALRKCRVDDLHDYLID